MRNRLTEMKCTKRLVFTDLVLLKKNGLMLKERMKSTVPLSSFGLYQQNNSVDSVFIPKDILIGQL